MLDSISAAFSSTVFVPPRGDSSEERRVIFPNSGWQSSLRFCLPLGKKRTFGLSLKCMKGIQYLVLYTYVNGVRGLDLGPEPLLSYPPPPTPSHYSTLPYIIPEKFDPSCLVIVSCHVCGLRLWLDLVLSLFVINCLFACSFRHVQIIFLCHLPS